MAYFKEPLDALIIETDVSATPAFVEMTVSLPDTPQLIMVGPMTQANNWMISTEEEVLCEGTSFSFGLAVHFSSYYIFNLQYQHDAACTLEFIQRICFDINPERGTKASHDSVRSRKSGKIVKKKATLVNPHVCTLIKKLSDFKWGFV